MILDEVKAAYHKDLISRSKRADERGMLDYRPIKVEQNLLQNTEGSALAHIGSTKVLAGVKFDLMAPFADRPDEGVIMVNGEFPPLAHPEFEAGPPNEESIELARVVDRGIRSAEAIDLKKLGETKDEEGRVLGVFVDLYVLDHNGNMIDTAALAAMAALSCARIPKVESNKLIRTESTGPLPLSRKVVTCSFSSIAGRIVLDATDEEETASDGRLTLGVTDDGLLCAGQKSGAAGFTKAQILDMADIALEKRSQLFTYV